MAIVLDPSNSGSGVLAAAAGSDDGGPQCVTKENFLYASDGREAITGLGFSQDGTQLHVSVNKGTLLNTYSVSKRQLVKQLGRGKHAASVNSVSSNGL